MDSISMMAGFMSAAAVFFFTDSNYIKTRMVYGISYICRSEAKQSSSIEDITEALYVCEHRWFLESGEQKI